MQMAQRNRQGIGVVGLGFRPNSAASPSGPFIGAAVAGDGLLHCNGVYS
jgi:hypothetical protein